MACDENTYKDSLSSDFLIKKTLFCRGVEGLMKGLQKDRVHNSSLKIMRENPQGLNKANTKDLVYLKVLEVQKQKDDRKIFYKQN